MQSYDPSSEPLMALPGYGYGDDSSAAPAPADPAPDPSGSGLPPLPHTAPTSTDASPLPPAQIAPAPAPLPAAANTQAAARRRAGAAIVIAGTGVGAGALLGGAWGAGSGLFFAGAACNIYRAKTLFASSLPVDRKEAIKTSVMAVVGLGLASYLGYRAHRARED